MEQGQGLPQQQGQQVAPSGVPQQAIQIPPFRLYGLIGCPHCIEAQNFLAKENLPTLMVLGNDDPIAEAGIKAITNKDVAGFPVLVCTFNRQIIEGFKEDEYRKLADAFHVLFGTGAPNSLGGGQQPVAQAEASPAPAPTGAI